MYSADGFTDRFVHRPCARRLVRLLIRLPVTPNAVTFAGLVLGVIAASQFWYATPHSAMLGVLLFFLQAVVDHADGELARMTGQVSEFGHRLDVSVDTLTDVLIVAGMAVTATAGEGPWTLVLASLGGGGILLCSLFTNFLPPPAHRPVTRVTLQLANRDPVSTSCCLRSFSCSGRPIDSCRCLSGLWSSAPTCTGLSFKRPRLAVRNNAISDGGGIGFIPAVVLPNGPT